jgi:hypothetical protein
VVPTAAAATPDASLAAAVDAERNLLAAQRQLLALYAHKLSPSLSEKLALRSTLQMLAGLPPGDIRLDRFWADNDVSLSSCYPVHVLASAFTACAAVEPVSA